MVEVEVEEGRGIYRVLRAVEGEVALQTIGMGVRALLVYSG